MNQLITRAIVLKRTNYGEADRILTLLTQDHGKLAVMARGVRKERSKLAGGVELFGVNEVGLLRGRGEVGTLTTSRLIKHFDHILADLDKTMAGYQLLKLTDKVTEDDAEPDYFDMLEQALAGLNNPALNIDLVQLWFNLRLLKISGHSPNLSTDNSGQALQNGSSYNFDTTDMTFLSRGSGPFQTTHIKVLRLVSQAPSPQQVARVVDIGKYLSSLTKLSETMRRFHLHA